MNRAAGSQSRRIIWLFDKIAIGPSIPICFSFSLKINIPLSLTRHNFDNEHC